MPSCQPVLWLHVTDLELLCNHLWMLNHLGLVSWMLTVWEQGLNSLRGWLKSRQAKEGLRIAPSHQALKDCEGQCTNGWLGVGLFVLDNLGDRFWPGPPRAQAGVKKEQDETLHCPLQKDSAHWGFSYCERMSVRMHFYISLAPQSSNCYPRVHCFLPGRTHLLTHLHSIALGSCWLEG